MVHPGGRTLFPVALLRPVAPLGAPEGTPHTSDAHAGGAGEAAAGEVRGATDERGGEGGGERTGTDSTGGGKVERIFVASGMG